MSIPARLLEPKLIDPVPEHELMAVKTNASGTSKSTCSTDLTGRYARSSAINRECTTTVSHYGVAVKLATSASNDSTPHVTPEAAAQAEWSIILSS
ncbi:MAG: hypothetical protein NTV68_01630 [Methanomicrobiales archaeon]|nr:hypothetical protein [Methanomicrobiales archaeon]